MDAIHYVFLDHVSPLKGRPATCRGATNTKSWDDIIPCDTWMVLKNVPRFVVDVFFTKIWKFNIAMENGPFVVYLPNYSTWWFSIDMWAYWRARIWTDFVGMTALSITYWPSNPLVRWQRSRTCLASLSAYPKVSERIHNLTTQRCTQNKTQTNLNRACHEPPKYWHVQWLPHYWRMSKRLLFPIPKWGQR